MIKMENILCPVDFSDSSAKAYDYAQSLAHHYGAKLLVEHVVEPLLTAYPYHAFPETWNEIYWSLDTEAEKYLRDLTKQHHWDGIQPQVVVHRGPVSPTILEFAKSQHADLIVLGTHGRQGFDRLVMGSVAERILRKANCPVLAVRKPVHDFVTFEPGKDPVQLRRILYCTDFSDHAERALNYALSLAIEYNAELTLLHVLEHGPASADLAAEMGHVARELEAPVPADARNWCSIKTAVRIGKPYQEIIQLALESQADLVVLGVRGRNALDLALFGSTTQRVLQLGSCPVLAVHV